MMEKDGSVGETPPPVQAAEAGHAEPQMQPGVSGSGGKLHVAYTKPECRTKMQPRGPSQERYPSHGMVDRSLQAQIGRQLRAIFADIAQEPVPERFIKLLEALEAREKQG
jgi:hypothetical protein